MPRALNLQMERLGLMGELSRALALSNAPNSLDLFDEACIGLERTAASIVVCYPATDVGTGPWFILDAS